MWVREIAAGGKADRHAAGMSDFWLSLWALCVALAWLLPNHYPPWTTFHLDAWMACVLTVTALWFLVRAPKNVSWTGLPVVVLLLAGLPLLQYSTGLVVFAGTAWMSTAYLVGALMACLVGAQWAGIAPRQLGDGIFTAVGIAAIVSVGLAYHQWLMLDRLDIWSMGGGASRAIANLGQPNQLGTLFVWSLLALAWGVTRGRIRPSIAIGAALFIMTGLALTGSRTAWIALILLIAGAWVWRQRWPHSRLPWAVTALGLCFAVLTVAVGPLTQRVLGGSGNDVADIVRIASELRPTIWAMFVDASLQRPWLGYGWGQISVANMEVALMHPALQAYFSHSHNLFLDLILWSGWPIGLAVSLFLMWWLVSRAVRVRTAEDALLFMLVLVVANHAMLELPLHHAYFLLPVGLVMGALDVRLGIRPLLTVGRWAAPVVWATWLLAAMLLAGIIRDYLRVEAVYQGLRYEWANIKTPPVEPPDVLLLTQWRDFVRMVKWDLGQPVRDEDLQWMQHVTSLTPNIGLFQIYAMSLARSGQPDKAAHWLRTMCTALPAGRCAQVASFWQFKARSDPALAAVSWPPATEARP